MLIIKLCDIFFRNRMIAIESVIYKLKIKQPTIIPRPQKADDSILDLVNITSL